ncbi:NAD-binding protein [Singulisphaera sp. Ch08]|uniref:NAD-binding protein n=1 Tax=Singulisphaera sp. Ch08 TaxID=3120278 RepID=A0AAU7C7U5_9BACT
MKWLLDIRSGAKRMQAPIGFAIYVRYLRFLLWEFRWSLGIFWSLVLVGGLVLHQCYHHRPLTYIEGCYSVFLLIFLEPYLDFPDEWYLQPLFFLLPIVGLGAVVDSLIRLGYLTFTKKSHLPEWQRMMASLYRNHIIVVGLGKVGFQVVQGILALREPVVVVERIGSDSTLIDEIIDLGVPVIRGDGRNAKTLELAGIGHARAVILATSDDLTNLDAGLTSKDLNPGAKIVLRLFDESLATKIAGAFSLPAISTAQVSATAFIAAATGRKVYQRFQLADQPLHLIDLTISPTGKLVGRTVGDVQTDSKVNVVMYHGKAGVNVNPGHDIVLEPDDMLLVIAPIDRLIEMESTNQPGQRPTGVPR